MKYSIFKLLVLSASCLLVFSGVSLAQTEDEDNRRAISAASSIYVISAKAGGVNYTEGKVAVNRKNGKSGYLLKGDNLEVGDKVSTGADGKVEILLNPGSFVRLGENTDFEFVTTSLEDLKLKVNRGSAMFEVLADNDFRVAVAAPKADFYLIKSGIYRIDVAANGVGVVEVWKGNAQIGDVAAAILKGGQTATVNGSETTVAKFDRDDKDPLEAWSKTRSKELAKINSKLDRRNLRSSLLSSFRSWNIYDSFGLWVFDPFYRTYCFLPFGYGWRSPYGYWFNRDIWSVPLPQVVYYPPQKDRTKAFGTGNPQAATRSTIVDRKTTDVRPPYTRIQRDVGPTFPSVPMEVPSRGGNFPARVPVAIPAPPSSPASVPMVVPGRGKDN